MFHRFFGKKKSSQPDTPGSPQGFGYKNKWLAVRSDDNQKVAQLLRIQKLRKATWKEGIKFGYEKGVFLTPEVEGWVLVLGIDISDIEASKPKNLLNRLSLEFGECQFFYTQRNIESHSWTLSKKGEIIRSYSFIAEEGNLEIIGKETEVEQSYHLPNTFSDEAQEEDYWENEDLDLPDEEMVMNIAEAWSINPARLSERTDIEGFCLVGT